jgi:hypothetical protein
MKAGAVYEKVFEGRENGVDGYKVRLISGGNSVVWRKERFEEWVPEVGDQVVGPCQRLRVIAEIDEKMFPNGKVGVRLLALDTAADEWVAFPDRQTMPGYLSPFTCTEPMQPNPKSADGREVRDLSHMDKTLSELFAEDSKRKLVAAEIATKEGPKLRPQPVGPERDPAFLHDEEAIGVRNKRVKELKDLLMLSRKRLKEAHVELVKLIGKEEADKEMERKL